MPNYPSIDRVCKVSAQVFTAERTFWNIRTNTGEVKVDPEAVRLGWKAQNGVSGITCDCRCIAMHVIAKHAPMHDPLSMEDRLLTNAQIGRHMGGVTRWRVADGLARACKLLTRYEYACMYYSILQELCVQGFDLWCLPKDLKLKKTA